ncbi:hypothetical protein Q763_06625 [Flavobacterium beibuense F44-8]|uniref:DUF4878 domain-containing protein n=1 Tax=Flavobacterium beibuense F44-8 TaxID=1406840 RepID=A0A0A2LNS3_9FLAO|nr:hypothetical protein [Flavobacterium beibuense]KGO81937.1 hypothetical protein Q763_06625 [Flavobacterium beibuense F44-8]
MKKHLIAFVLLFTAISGFSQDVKALKTTAEEMYKHSVNKDFEAVTEFIYPKFFEILPKEQMVEGMKQMLEGNDDFKMEITNTALDIEVGDIKTINNGYYTTLKQNYALKMIFKDVIPEDSSEMFIDMYKKMLNTEDVTFNAKDNSLNIIKRIDYIAIANNLTNNKWRFIGAAQPEVMNQILDPEVIKELGL